MSEFYDAMMSFCDERDTLVIADDGEFDPQASYEVSEIANRSYDAGFADAIEWLERFRPSRTQRVSLEIGGKKTVPANNTSTQV